MLNHSNTSYHLNYFRLGLQKDPLHLWLPLVLWALYVQLLPLLPVLQQNL